MKNIKYIIALSICMFSFQLFAQTPCSASNQQTTQVETASKKGTKLIKTESFIVQGHCISCKEKIESAAKIRGVKSAEWTPENLTLTVTYDCAKTSIANINEAVVKATGYETSFSVVECETRKKTSACCAAQKASETPCQTK